VCVCVVVGTRGVSMRRFWMGKRICAHELGGVARRDKGATYRRETGQVSLAVAVAVAVSRCFRYVGQSGYAMRPMIDRMMDKLSSAPSSLARVVISWIVCTDRRLELSLAERTGDRCIQQGSAILRPAAYVWRGSTALHMMDIARRIPRERTVGLGDECLHFGFLKIAETNAVVCMKFLIASWRGKRCSRGNHLSKRCRI